MIPASKYGAVSGSVNVGDLSDEEMKLKSSITVSGVFPLIYL